MSNLQPAPEETAQTSLGKGRLGVLGIVFFAFIGRGLGVAIGVGSAFISLIVYLAIQLAIFGFFDVVMAGEMNKWFGLDVASLAFVG